MTTSNTSDTVMGAIGGVATGYVLWLLAISIGDDVTTVSRWSLVVLVASVCWRSAPGCGAGRCAGAASISGRRLRSACRYSPWC